MRTYHHAWCAFWSTVMVIGVGLAVLQWSAIGAFITLGLLYALCRLVRHLLPHVAPGWLSMRMAVGILSVVALCRVTPTLGLFVVLTAGLSSPGVVGRAIRSARHTTHARTCEPPPDATPAEPRPDDVEVSSRLRWPEAMGPLNGLDDRQLCRLWRESFWVLRDPVPSGTVLRLVALRGACLDELERRDASALQAWLDSGARASSGPEKYLAHPALPCPEAGPPPRPPRPGDPR